MALTMSGHMNRDPCSGTGLYAYDEHRPVPKVRPEAQDYYESGTKGSVGLLFELQGMSIRPRSKAPPKPADHIRENVRRMRQVQRESRQRQQEASKPMKPLFKSAKWEGVESKVKKNLENPWPTPRPESRNFLRSHSRQGQPRPRSASPALRPRTMSAGGVRPQSARATSAAGQNHGGASPCTLDGGKENGRRGEVPPLEVTGTKTGYTSPTRDDVDFVAHNARRAWKDCNRLKRPPTKMALQDLEDKRKKNYDSYKRGEVPKYLRHRQDEWRKEEEERIRNTPDPSMPPGHTMMPEAERKETLKKLKDTEQDLLKQMRELPIGRSDTLRIKHAKEELEKKLSEIDEAIKIFSRPKVFVKIDD